MSQGIALVQGNARPKKKRLSLKRFLQGRERRREGDAVVGRRERESGGRERVLGRDRGEIKWRKNTQMLGCMMIRME